MSNNLIGLPYNGSYRIVVGLYISPHIKAVLPNG